MGVRESTHPQAVNKQQLLSTHPRAAASRTPAACAVPGAS